MQVERMFAGVIAVEDYLDNLVLFENISVNVGPVDGGIGGRCTSGNSSEKSWDFRPYVGNTVEECTWLGSQKFDFMRDLEGHTNLHHPRGCSFLGPILTKGLDFRKVSHRLLAPG